MNGQLKVIWIYIKHLLLLELLKFVAVSSSTYYCKQGNTVTIQGQTSGTIVTRQQGNGFYDNNLDCSWVIDGGSNHRIKLTVTKLDLQWSPTYTTCEAYDHLKLLNGQTKDSKFLLAMCHSRNPNYVVSPGQYLHLNFFSNDKNFYDHAGIELKFETFDETDCPPRWRTFSSSPDKCYYLMEKPAGGTTFSEAQQYCAYSQANLVTVETEKEFDEIQDYGNNIAKINNMWVGLNDIGQEGSYQWLDGSPHLQSKLVTSTNSVLNDCAVHNFKDETWELKQCSRDKYFFMCEKNKVGTTPLYSIPEEDKDDTGKGEFTLLWAVVLGIVGGIACVVVAILVYCFCIGKRKRRYTNTNGSNPEEPVDSPASHLNEIRPSAPAAVPYSADRPPDAPPTYQESIQHTVIK